jgi:hypothetical protein
MQLELRSSIQSTVCFAMAHSRCLPYKSHTLKRQFMCICCFKAMPILPPAVFFPQLDDQAVEHRTCSASLYNPGLHIKGAEPEVPPLSLFSTFHRRLPSRYVPSGACTQLHVRTQRHALLEYSTVNANTSITRQGARHSMAWCTCMQQHGAVRCTPQHGGCTCS